MSVYTDMSVRAIAERYASARLHWVERIKAGDISASMSGIEDYPETKFHHLTDEYFIKPRMTWNGERHIDRPDWRAEFDAYRAGMLAENPEDVAPHETNFSTIPANAIGRRWFPEIDGGDR